MSSLNMQAAADEVLRVVRTSDVASGMKELIAWCAEAAPHEIWKTLSKIDWEKDSKRNEAWLKRLMKDEPPPASITGFWFGVFHPVTSGGKTSTELYVCGNPYRADAEWAPSPAWWPERRYSDSRVLAEMSKVLLWKEDELAADAVYPVALAYAGLAVKSAAQKLGPLLLTGGAPERTLVAGFDSGDAVVVGRMDAAGFTVISVIGSP